MSARKPHAQDPTALALAPKHAQARTNTVLTPSAGTQRYACLRQDVSDAGILDRDHRYYALLVATVVCGIAVSLYYVIHVPVSLPLVFWMLVFSFFAVQACGVVHDAGHRTIFASTAWNNVVGEAFSVFLGMGFMSWRLTHNVHHAHTNVDGEDPDLKIPLQAFTAQQIQRQGRVARRLRRYQATVFYPMRTLVVFSRRLSNIDHFRQQHFGPRLLFEVALWAAELAAWFVLPFVVFPVTKALLFFVIVHPTMGFYLSNVFAPNHKGMPQFQKGVKISFLEQQIRTSRNVTPNWFIDVVFMGLNYQIEHHLFPTCPRGKLNQITPYVRAVCRETGLPYTEVGVIEANRLILRALNVGDEPVA